MLAFCALGPPTLRQLPARKVDCWHRPSHISHRVASRRPIAVPASIGTASPSASSSKFSMSLRGLSYAAAAIVLSMVSVTSLPNVPHMLQPALANESEHLNSAPQRFSQSFTLEEASSSKLDAHWDVHSQESRTETFVMFANDSSHVVDIWWIDYYGREVYYASIRPGTSHMQPSYATHPWVVRDHISQNPLLVMVAKDNPALAIVNNTV